MNIECAVVGLKRLLHGRCVQMVCARLTVMTAVLPLWLQARRAVGGIKRENIDEIRSLKMPPDAIRDVLEVCAGVGMEGPGHVFFLRSVGGCVHKCALAYMFINTQPHSVLGARLRRSTAISWRTMPAGCCAQLSQPLGPGAAWHSASQG